MIDVNRIFAAGYWFLAGVGFGISLVGIIQAVPVAGVGGAIACVIGVAFGIHYISKD